MSLGDHDEDEAGKKVWLSRTDVDRLVDTADDTEKRVAFELGARCGLRSAEILEVASQDVVVDVAEQYVEFRRVHWADLRRRGLCAPPTGGRGPSARELEPIRLAESVRDLFAMLLDGSLGADSSPPYYSRDTHRRGSRYRASRFASASIRTSDRASWTAHPLVERGAPLVDLGDVQSAELADPRLYFYLRFTKV
ncbi:hypothetical protein [Halorubrum sp. 48-1-W]|uniref:hypothetical protein n=1 Tax=Halorubrum sp. 48-1-W TaxID=2249761 RepID=UPI0013005352|nr:hypothetical protein [Halorubrum sp. 48-1-W]